MSNKPLKTVEQYPYLGVIIQVGPAEYNNNSSISDVGAVLRHIQKWGENDSMSPHQLTLKLVMLMALTRPAI